ncbi:MAG: flavin reductase family protein [Actinomycetota bacterium]|nr:flavin reductase family protein [Actinomycetota bacterium]
MPEPDLSSLTTVAPDAFKSAFRHHASGVAIVTADAGDGPLALTASSVTSVSAAPAILLFSVSSTTETGRAIARASTAVVHLLDADDHGLALRCADPMADRFGDPRTWDRLAGGEPVFRGPRVVLRGEVVQRLVFDEAVVMLLAVVEVIDRGPRASAARPLAYHDRRWHALGQHSQLDTGSVGPSTAGDAGPSRRD